MKSFTLKSYSASSGLCEVWSDFKSALIVLWFNVFWMGHCFVCSHACAQGCTRARGWYKFLPIVSHHSTYLLVAVKKQRQWRTGLLSSRHLGSLEKTALQMFSEAVNPLNMLLTPQGYTECVSWVCKQTLRKGHRAPLTNSHLLNNQTTVIKFESNVTQPWLVHRNTWHHISPSHFRSVRRAQAKQQSKKFSHVK